MSSVNSISPEKLVRLIGVPRGPALVDVRLQEDFAADPRFIPGAIRRPHETVSSWAPEFVGRSAVVICEKGQTLSEGVAAWTVPHTRSADLASRSTGRRGSSNGHRRANPATQTG